MRAHVMRVPLLGLMLSAAAADHTAQPRCGGSAFANQTWRPVCEGVDLKGTSPRHYLSGKHLVLGNSHYPPFAEKAVDSDGHVTWTGWDFYVLPYIADLLNFTYEVVDVEDVRCVNGTMYDEEWLRYVLQHTDMMLQWWAPTSGVTEFAVVSFGYVDISPTLISYQPRSTSSETFFQRLKRAPDSFLDPLSYGVWGVILLIILLSALVDYTLERTHPESSLLGSLYESCAGALWGGFEQPKTRISAIYQVMLSFIILVFVASYTANTAAFLTVRTVQAETAQSIEEAIAKGRYACVYPGDPFMNYYRSEFQDLRLLESESIHTTLTDVTARKCDVIIAPTFRVWLWLSDENLCSFQQRDTLKRADSGWASSLANHCVRDAVTWAMTRYAAIVCARAYAHSLPTPCPLHVHARMHAHRQSHALRTARTSTYARCWHACKHASANLLCLQSGRGPHAAAAQGCSLIDPRLPQAAARC